MTIIVDGLPYPVIVASDAGDEAARILSADRGSAFVVADTVVKERAGLVAAALRCELAGEMVALAGERRKRWSSVSALHQAWLERGVDRGCTIVAVGGGTLTDVAGLAAATYLRGVRWLPIATTLLGMVDAAIGGKTGVNLPEGKNLIGAIWQPIGMVADLAALATLPAPSMSDGVAEMVKAAIVGDATLLDELERGGLERPPTQWAPLVAAAAGVKVKIVAADPEDRGARAALNLGHTFAHAFERASRYRLSHGAAVALGLRAAGILARDRTGWKQVDQRRIMDVLKRYGLRLRLTGLSSDSVIEAMKSDKKRSHGTGKLVLPVRVGEVRWGVEVSDDDVRLALDELSQVPRRRGW